MAMLKPAVCVDEMGINQTRVWRFLLNFVDKAEEAGMYLLMWYCNNDSFIAYLFVTDLKAFIQFVTGSPAPLGVIAVVFTEDHFAEAVVANTCGKQLTLSSR